MATGHRVPAGLGAFCLAGGAVGNGPLVLSQALDLG